MHFSRSQKKKNAWTKSSQRETQKIVALKGFWLWGFFFVAHKCVSFFLISFYAFLHIRQCWSLGTGIARSAFPHDSALVLKRSAQSSFCSCHIQVCNASTLLLNGENLEEVRKILKREREGYRNVPTLSTNVSDILRALRIFSESESIKQVTDLSAAIFSRLLRALCTFRFGGHWPAATRLHTSSEINDDECVLSTWLQIISLFLRIFSFETSARNAFLNSFYPARQCVRGNKCFSITNIIQFLFRAGAAEEKKFLISLKSFFLWIVGQSHHDLRQPTTTTTCPNEFEFLSFAACFFLIVCFERLIHYDASRELVAQRLIDEV